MAIARERRPNTNPGRQGVVHERAERSSTSRSPTPGEPTSTAPISKLDLLRSKITQRDRQLDAIHRLATDLLAMPTEKVFAYAACRTTLEQIAAIAAGKIPSE